MGGGSDGLRSPSLASGPRTLLLMDHTGNRAFKSRTSLSGVTSSAECWTDMLTNGDIVKVIDIPGLFEFCVGNESISEEIGKCIELAKDGIDAVLLVFSFGARFTKEEAAAVESLRSFFGPKTIVVFTKEEDESVEDLLGSDQEHLQKILELCDNRIVLFDNKAGDEKKEASQLEEIFSLLDMVMETNGGKPCSDNLFKEISEGATKHQLHKNEMNSLGVTEQELTELMKNIRISYDEQLKRMMEMVESKLMETNQKLEQQLAEEKTARLNAEKIAREQSEYEIQELKENLADAKKTTEEFTLHLIFFTILIYLVLLW